MCYTYDNLSRVTARTVKKLSDNSVISTETFAYDAAGNITDAPDSCFQYDTNNRLVVFNGNAVSYDLDGNMLNNGVKSFTYDSANRLISAGGYTYTYNAEDVRIRNLCTDEDTTYTYNTNAKLSMLLMKTTDGVVTKYVYGRGLIGEEKQGSFKIYHFDYRGSTVAITDASGSITDTFKYDTYGKLIGRTGSSFVIFGYNGRDGVVTDKNGLIYMRARYYSPELRRFVNADVIHGEISDSTTLNRYAFVNGNPVSYVDPFGMDRDNGNPYGSLTYQGNNYSIYLPDDFGAINDNGWVTDKTEICNFVEFNWLKFLTGVELGNRKNDKSKIQAGNYKDNQFAVSSGNTGGLGWQAGFSVVPSLISSLENSFENSYIKFIFQKKNQETRVVITVGSHKANNQFSQFADGIPRSVFWAQAGSALGYAVVSSEMEEKYKLLTGKNDTHWYQTWDAQVTVDKRHRNTSDTGLLWFNSEGILMEKPLLYSNDRVQLGTRGFLGIGFTPRLDVDISQSMPASSQYQEWFDQAYKKLSKPS